MAKKKSAAAKRAQRGSKPRKSPISRDVGVQSKGPRLQRLRAILLLIQAASRYPDSNALAAVECHGDVHIAIGDIQKCTEYSEEDKNYDSATSFSMNSHEILNSLVIFIDQWVSKGCSSNVKFGFYTPNTYTSEKNTSKSEGLGVTWPERPMLELLSESNLAGPGVLESAKKMAIGEYESQVASHKAGATLYNPLAHLGVVKAWTDTDWRQFFGQIQWCFGEADADLLQGSLRSAIRASPLYNSRVKGKEDLIIARLNDLLDKRQSYSDITQRFVSSAEVALIFKEVEAKSADEQRVDDPTWSTWKGLPEPVDTRNISDKVREVCSPASSELVNRWSRRASQSLSEQQAFSDDKEILALKYRVFDACEERLSEIRGASLLLNPKELRDLMAELTETARRVHKECSRQFHYKIQLDAIIDGIVYELIDSCFLTLTAQGGAA